MKLITTENTRPAYNLAAEEYILKNKRGDIFFLWRNAPAIIIGKNQNAYSEINIEYVKKNNIEVIRRLTGGGAVFHDLGNINFSFFTDSKEGEDVSFERFTAPIVDFLRSLGLNAAFAGRNDIQLDGMKISGNAQTRLGGRFLHHGTLLFGASMADMSAALNVHPLKISSKGIKSVSARVTNISEHLQEKMDVTAFMALLLEYISRTQSDAERYILTPADLAGIDSIAAQRYCRWDWNFGENPDYSFNNTAKYAGGLIEVSMNITEEVIDDIRISGDFFAYDDIRILEDALRGISHKREDIERAIRDIPLHKYIGGITAQELIDTMF